jgi:cation diffusion facilitator CzcD-associated flavoprotein CzcO
MRSSPASNIMLPHRLPIRYETQVTAVAPSPTGQGLVTTDDSTWEAANVVVATGLFQQPRDTSAE